jgi:hypothetical protein
MIPSIWDWQKKAKILQACLQSFCFTLPHSRSECTCPFVRIRVHPGNQWFYIILSCNMM